MADNEILIRQRIAGARFTLVTGVFIGSWDLIGNGFCMFNNGWLDEKKSEQLLISINARHQSNVSDWNNKL